MANLFEVPQFGYNAPIPEDEPFIVNAKKRRPMEVSSEPAPINVSPPSQEDINQESGNVPSALAQAANPDYYSQILAKMNSPEYQALQKELRDRSQHAIDQQQQGIDANEKSINDLANKGPRADLSPLLGWFDSMSGGQSAKNYQRPDSPDDRAMKIMNLQNALQTQKQGLSKEQIDSIKSQMDMMNPLKNMLPISRLEQRGQMIGLREDAQAAGSSKEVHNNPIIQQAAKQLGQLQIDRHTVENTPVITPQILHEISNGIANALSGGRGVGLGMADMQDLSTSQTRLAALEQQLTNAPQNGASPAIRAQIVDTLNRLEDSYKKYQHDIAQRITVGKTYNHNKQARDAQAAAVAEYNYTPPEQSSPAPHGQTITQDGHTYNWNAKTGNYE